MIIYKQTNVRRMESEERKKVMKKKVIKSSAAEYLTFITATGESGVEAIYADESVWLSQKMMGMLYDVETNTINYHLKKLFDDQEIDENSVIRNFRITAQDGKKYNTKHYNLKAIIAVGNKVDSPKAVQFRKWAINIIEEYTIKGYAMDDERLKNGGTVLTKQYFEQLLERIREIRLSERKFYQKITDIYATALDYDSSSDTTKRFFAAVQNKIHFAVHGNTAAEIQAERHIPMTMMDWEERLNGFLNMMDYGILHDKGKISAEMAKLHAESEFEKYRIAQDNFYESDFDRFLELENKVMEK